MSKQNGILNALRSVTPPMVSPTESGDQTDEQKNQIESTDASVGSSATVSAISSNSEVSDLFKQAREKLAREKAPEQLNQVAGQDSLFDASLSRQSEIAMWRSILLTEPDADIDPTLYVDDANQPHVMDRLPENSEKDVATHTELPELMYEDNEALAGKSNFEKLERDLSDSIETKIRESVLEQSDELDIPLIEEKSDSVGQKTSHDPDTTINLMPANEIISEDASIIDQYLDVSSIAPKDNQSILEKLKDVVSEQLDFVPEDQICAPDATILGPVFELLRYAHHKPATVQLCGNLIATAMNSSTARFAHPSFATVIRNLTADEIRVLRTFCEIRVLPVIDIKKVSQSKESELLLNTLVSTIGVDAGCEHEDMAETYLANMERLGLLDIPREIHLTDANWYDRILESPPVKQKLQSMNGLGGDYRGEVVKYYAKLSIFGLQFATACVTGH